MPELEEVERFGAMISKLALPETLAGNTQRLERYKLALLSAVESLYRDKKKPFLGELKRLLKPSKQWLNQELRAAATVSMNGIAAFPLKASYLKTKKLQGSLRFLLAVRVR